MIGFYNYTVILTYVGAASGILGIIAGAKGNSIIAVLCLLFSGFCDMFDGTVARTRKRTEDEKKFGIEIDSLTDMVCFAVLPIVIGYACGMKEWYFVPFGALYCIAAISRLGYYNVTEDHRQQQESGKRKYYQGLPVTTSAVIFPVLWAIDRFFFKTSLSPWVYAIVTLLTAIAFISNIKIRKPGTKGIIIIALVGFAVIIGLFFIGLIL